MRLAITCITRSPLLSKPVLGTILPSMGDGTIKKIREAVGETQARFAERLGVSLRTVKRFEKNNTLPTSISVLRTVQELAQRHGISLD